MKKNAKKFLLFVLSIILISSYNINVFAKTATYSSAAIAQSSHKLIAPTETEGGIFIPVNPKGKVDLSGKEIVATKEADGRFTAKMPLATANAEVGSITFYLNQSDSVSNMYSISYSIASTGLVNGVRGTIVITNTSILFKQTYYSKYHYRDFVATTLYYGNAGSVIIPADTTKVRLRFNDSSMYFLSSGWTPGINLTSTFDVN